MDLGRMWSWGIDYVCCKCLKTVHKDVYADRDGEAFQSYYCTDCANKENGND